LVAHQIDRVIAGQLAVDAVVRVTKVHRFVAAVVFGHFLLHDIRADGGRQMVGLTGKIRRNVIIHAVFFERVIAQIRPQHSHHTQLVRALKRR